MAVLTTEDALEQHYRAAFAKSNGRTDLHLPVGNGIEGSGKWPLTTVPSGNRCQELQWANVESAYPLNQGQGSCFIRSVSMMSSQANITVLGLDGKVLAHGQREDLINKVPIEAKDRDGKLFVKERVELAPAVTVSFWRYR